MVRRILILLYDIGKRIYNKINKIFENFFYQKTPTLVGAIQNTMPLDYLDKSQ